MTDLEPGTRAPTFSVPPLTWDQGEERVSLTEKDFRGRSRILAFYYADWSSIFGDQLAVNNAVRPDARKPAPVTLDEFGDYECPHCRKAHPIVKQLRQRFGDRLEFRFRNFPLAQIHPHAKHAAEAAVSVRSQAGEDAFWAMHDAIFEHQRESPDALDDTHLARYAEEAGADAARVRYDLDTGRFEETVEVDFVDGMRLGVHGTPTFFINDQRFVGDWREIEQLATAIGDASARSTIVALG